MHGFLRKGLAALAAASVPIVYTLASRPWHLRWGATEEECTRPLPGDAIVPDGIQSTRAIIIHALGNRLYETGLVPFTAVSN